MTVYSDAAKQRLEALLGLGWQQILADHPRQARRYLRDNTEPPILKAAELIANDAAYDELVELTHKETDVSGLVKAVMPYLTAALMAVITGKAVEIPTST